MITILLIGLYQTGRRDTRRFARAVVLHDVGFVDAKFSVGKAKVDAAAGGTARPICAPFMGSPA